MCPWSHTLSWWLYGVFSVEKIFVIWPLQERQNQSLSCVGAQHRNAHAKTCYSTHHEHGMNFVHNDSCLTSLDRYRKSFDQSSLSLSLVLCSETFGMDTLTCGSNKCLVEHHSLGIFNQAVLWLYGSPPLWCVGMSRVLSLKYTLTSNFPRGITSLIGSFCWTFCQTLPWRWLTSVICLSTSSHLNSMLFSMICNWVCTGDDMSLLSRLLPWAFSSMSIYSMLKILSTKLVLLFISHPPIHDVWLKWSWTTTK